MFSPELKNFTNPLPPNEVHFLDLKIEPWADRKRVKIFIKISEFSSPPNLNFSLKNKKGEIFSQVTMIENVDTDIVFTMHLRGNSEDANYILNGEIFYPGDYGIVDKEAIEFTIPL